MYSLIYCWWLAKLVGLARLAIERAGVEPVDCSPKCQSFSLKDPLLESGVSLSHCQSYYKEHPENTFSFWYSVVALKYFFL